METLRFDAEGAGHGGMDFFVVNAFVQSVITRRSATHRRLRCRGLERHQRLSEQSIAMGSAPVRFPDFTGGKWVTRRSIFGESDEF